jgi:hypothetical protein
MSTAVATTRVPLLSLAEEYWQEFVEACKGRTADINAVAADHGECGRELLEVRPGAGLHIVREQCPSTTIRAALSINSWGPAISGTITGDQDHTLRFSTEQFELPIALDLDGRTVAVFGEGRSFSPQELACYVMQNFRRCYPGVTLPC